jgi:DnaJ family protein C protein 19
MLLTSIPFLQATALIAGLAVAGAALAGRYSIQAWHAYKARPIVPRMRKFYEGGFQATMTRREAGLILGIRCVLYKLQKHNFHARVNYSLCFSWHTYIRL